MQTDNYALFSQALKLYIDVMRRVIGERLNSIYGSEWWEKGVLRCLNLQKKNQLLLDSQNHPSRDLIDYLDPSLFIWIIIDEQNHQQAFNTIFGDRRPLRSHLQEIADARNEWGHPTSGDLHVDDVQSTLLLMSRVLRGICEPETEQIQLLIEKLRASQPVAAPSIREARFAAAERSAELASREDVLRAEIRKRDWARATEALLGIRALEPAHPDMDLVSEQFEHVRDRLSLHYQERLLKRHEFSSMRTLEGHHDTIIALAFSPDRRILASTGFDEKLILWEAASGRQLKEIVTCDYPITLAFAPSGALLAVGLRQGIIQVWDVATMSEVKQFGEPDPPLRRLENDYEGTVSSVAFSSDGQLMAGNIDDTTVHLWNTTTWDEVKVIPSDDHVCSIAFSPNGSILAVGYFTGLMRMWDLQRDVDMLPSKDVRQARFLSNEVLVHTTSDALILHNVADGATSRLEGDFGALAFDHSGSLMACAGRPGNEVLRVLSLPSGDPVAEVMMKRNIYRSGGEEILCTAIAPDCSMIASGTFQGRLRLFSV